MFVVFYFLLIRPQKKKDKKVKEMLAALKNGDRVCTIGGIYGTITSIKDDTIELSVGPRQCQAGLCPLGHPQRGGSRHRKRQRGSSTDALSGHEASPRSHILYQSEQREVFLMPATYATPAAARPRAGGRAAAVLRASCAAC